MNEKTGKFDMRRKGVLALATLICVSAMTGCVGGQKKVGDAAQTQQTQQTTTEQSAKQQTPDTKQQAPAAKQQTPAAKQQTPAAKQQTPAAKQQTPTAKQQAPAAQKGGIKTNAQAPIIIKNAKK